MVDKFDAYRILNQAVLNVANDLVQLEVIETHDKPSQLRMEEAVYSVSETRGRLDGTVVVAHDLEQYINRFYSITLNTNDAVWIDYLVGHRIEDIDLTEFGEYV